MASTRAPAKPLATNSRRAARRMRSRVRTGSRREVTIWIPKAWPRVSIRLLGVKRSAGGGDQPPGSAGVRSGLRGQALLLHVAPELLGHLSGPDRCGAEQRLQAV